MHFLFPAEVLGWLYAKLPSQTVERMAVHDLHVTKTRPVRVEISCNIVKKKVSPLFPATSGPWKAFASLELLNAALTVLFINPIIILIIPYFLHYWKHWEITL